MLDSCALTTRLLRNVARRSGSQLGGAQHKVAVHHQDRQCDLRRTAATTLHDSGVPLKTISAMLGHAAVTTTIRYLGLKSENLKQAGDILAAKYHAPVENVRNRVESVPESVPQSIKIAPRHIDYLMHKID